MRQLLTFAELTLNMSSGGILSQSRMAIFWPLAPRAQEKSLILRPKTLKRCHCGASGGTATEGVRSRASTPPPPVCIRRQFTYPKTCSPRPSPPFVEVAARSNSGREMGVKEAENFCVGVCGVNPSPPYTPLRRPGRCVPGPVDPLRSRCSTNPIFTWTRGGG